MMKSEQSTDDTNQRLETAGEWLLQIQDGALEQDELAAWLAWYEADPANRSAFERVQQTFESLHALPGAERTAWAAQVLADTERPKPPARKSWLTFVGGGFLGGWFVQHRGLAGGLASMLIVLAGVGYWKAFDTGVAPVKTAAYKTDRAEHQNLTLPDGSHVRLGAQSQLFLNFTSQARYVVLEGGEAFFEVAKDSHRPFLVQAGAVTVRAVGTEFNVRRVIDRTEVAVAEGVVEVTQGLPPSPMAASSAMQEQGLATSLPSTVQLKAGEQITIGDAVAAVAIKPVEPAKVASWQQGRLEFIDEPLRFVIATVNRYASREIVITDQSINDLHFTGTVSRDRIDEWLAAIPDVLPVEVQRAGSEAVLLSRRAAVESSVQSRQ
jgi:transmembrane sensor